MNALTTAELITSGTAYLCVYITFPRAPKALSVATPFSSEKASGLEIIEFSAPRILGASGANVAAGRY